MESFDFTKVSKSTYELKTYKQRERFTKILADEYVICIQKILVKNDMNIAKISFEDSKKPLISLNNVNGTNKISEELKFVLCVNLSLQSLNSLFMEILYNEYIFPKDKQWWRSFYSPSTYYRNRTLAINKFTEIYNYD